MTSSKMSAFNLEEIQTSLPEVTPDDSSSDCCAPDGTSRPAGLYEFE